jgi:hypothetical protein
MYALIIVRDLMDLDYMPEIQQINALNVKIKDLLFIIIIASRVVQMEHFHIVIIIHLKMNTENVLLVLK